MRYYVPYGRGKKGRLDFTLPSHYQVTEYHPSHGATEDSPCSDEEIRANVRQFLSTDAPSSRPRSVSIAINDGSRPPIQRRILPILISELERHVAAEVNFILCICNGLHAPQSARQVAELIPAQYLKRCQIVNHDAHDRDMLTFLGDTSAGSPIWINSAFYNASWRMSIAAVTGHQFVGVSGGSKSVSIGLAGAETITHNHSLYQQPYATLGEIERNPVRLDIEEIGRKIGLTAVVNCALNSSNDIVSVKTINMQRADSLAAFNAFASTVVTSRHIDSRGGYDGVIIAAGGYPRDCNLYQLQKALAHGAPLAAAGSPIILCGACDEGVGGEEFEAHFAAADSVTSILEQQQSEQFRIGPHKSALFARDMQGRQVALVSRLSPKTARRLHFTPLRLTQDGISRFFAGAGIGTASAGQQPRIAVVPHAVHCYFNIHK